MSPAPKTPTGSRPWRRSASTRRTTRHYSVDDVAKAVVFMNPLLTMLTTASAETVLGHIGRNNNINIKPLSFMISALGPRWCQTAGVVDNAGKPVLKPNGTQFYTYDLHQFIINASATPNQQSKALIYSDRSLQGARWKLLPGVSVLDMNAQNDAARRAVRRRRPDRQASGGLGSRDDNRVAVQAWPELRPFRDGENPGRRQRQSYRSRRHQRLYPAHLGLRELLKGGRYHGYSSDERRLAQDGVWPLRTVGKRLPKLAGQQRP